MFQEILKLNSEWAPAYYGLFTTAKIKGDKDQANLMQEKYEFYKVDDRINEVAINKARLKYPAADKAANRLVLYQLDSDPSYPLTLQQFQAKQDIIIID